MVFRYWVLCLLVVGCSDTDDGGRPNAGGQGAGGQAGLNDPAGTGGNSVSGVGSGGVTPGTGGAPGDSSGDGEGCVEAIDIVFVMDVSLSMAGFFEKLEAEILVVDQALRMLDVAQPPHYGLAVFVDDALVVNNGAPFTTAEELRDQFVEWRQFTGLNSQVLNQQELNFDWTENSLDGIYLAVTQFQWRPVGTTLRMIIHTTDDTFWDNGVTAGDDGLAGNGNPRSMYGYMQTITAIRDASIRVNHFAAHMRTYDNSNVDVSAGFFTPYKGQQTIPLSTGGVAWEIGDVLAGTVSLAEDIRTSVIDTRCEEYPDIVPLE